MTISPRQFLPSLRAACLCMALLASAAPALAQQADRPRRGKEKDVPYAPPPPTLTASPVALMIAGMDRDGDGSISRAEFDAAVARSFDRASRGAAPLSLIDLSNWARDNLGDPGARPGQFDFDTNGDDQISRAEFLARFDQIFTARDKNGDGALGRAELLDFGSPCRVGPAGRGERPGAPPADAPGGRSPR